MFKVKKLLFLILLCYLSVSGLNGQNFHKGLIFSSNGDTAKGWVLLPSGDMPASICFFKPTSTDKAVLLSASEIAGFQSFGETYISTNITINNRDSLLFIKSKYSGPHELRYFEINKIKFFIIIRPDSSLFEIRYPPELNRAEVLSGLSSDKKFTQQAGNIFPDAPYLPEYQKGIKPEINSVLNLFKQYNDLDGGTFSAVAKKAYKKGFIVTTSMDTLHGFLLNNLDKTFYTTCLFSPGRKDSLFKFLPSEITQFGNSRKTRLFVRAELPSREKHTTVFARLLFEGSVDLMYYDREGTGNYLFRDNQDRIHHASYSTVISKRDVIRGLNPAVKFRLQADSILSILQISGKEIKPEPKYMLRVLEDYHEIMSLPYNNYFGISRRMALSVVAGAKFENYLFDTDNDGYKSYSSPSPYIGLHLTMFNKMGNLGFLLRNTVGYHNINYSYTQRLETYSYFRQTTIKSYADNLEAGLIFRPVKKLTLKPFFEAGGTGRYYFNSSYNNNTEENYSDQFVFSHYDHDVMNSSFFFGGFARVGLARTITPKKSISLSCGYSYLVSTGLEKIHSAEFSIIYNFLRR